MNSINNFFWSDVFQVSLACLISMILFAAMIIYISKNPSKRTTPLKIAFIVMFLGGIIIYCMCHYMEIMQAVRTHSGSSELSWVKRDYASWLYVPYVIIRSVMDVGIMFYGRNNSDVFYALEESQNPVAVLIFWLIHMIAFFTGATALLIHFGNNLLRWIRIMTTKISDVILIFGVNQDSLMFGRNIAGKKGIMLVYVDNVISEKYEAAIINLGGLTYTDKESMTASVAFIKSLRIKPHKTKFKLYALSDEYDRNFQYARMMSESLKDAGVFPDQTSLVLLGTEEWKGMNFQSSESQYGYGSVISFDEFEMSARLLIHEYPLCNAINFDETCRASEDMNVLIVGFGRMGHEVLRKIIANGQFEGSRFHATIYQPGFENLTGFFTSQYPKMFANYNIDFEPHGGRGNKIFRFLQENAASLKYIVICIEDREVARDIAVHMSDRLQTMGYSLNVYTCDSKSVRCYSQYAKECQTHWLYDSELLYSGDLDKYAMELNHHYTGGSSLLEDWKNCGYFERMSSRASIDYMMPLLRAIKAEVFTSEQRENLAKSEHLRWCAFYYTFGFDLMEKEEFIERIRKRLDEIREKGKSSIKVTNDKKSMKHACLVDWDELDEISRIENSLTHGNKNYKEYDRANVDVIKELMNE